jgi:hypothetical protein
MYLWANNYGSMARLKIETGIASDHTIVDWKSFFRCTVRDYIVSRPQSMQVGGLDPQGNPIIVQVDESVFVRRKYHRGRLVREVWIVGGIEYYPANYPNPPRPRLFLVVLQTDPTGVVPVGSIGAGQVTGLVPDAVHPNVYPRSQHNLHAIIRSLVLPGSAIHTDAWAGYLGIANITDANGVPMGYVHRIVVHRHHFVDPATGVHTQAIENAWMNAKKRNVTERGTARSQIESYLFQEMWRQQYGGEPFQNLVIAIRDQYRV